VKAEQLKARWERLADRWRELKAVEARIRERYLILRQTTADALEQAARALVDYRCKQGVEAMIGKLNGAAAKLRAG
jgi:hypothetical protein